MRPSQVLQVRTKEGEEEVLRATALSAVAGARVGSPFLWKKLGRRGEEESNAEEEKKEVGGRRG